MRSVNKVILIGNLGKDPEVHSTSGGKSVANFSLATSWRVKKDDEWQDQTEWHNIVAWEKLAEVAAKYAKKGGKVYIEGRLQTRSWDDEKTGQTKYKTEVVANELVLLDSKAVDKAKDPAKSSDQMQQGDPRSEEVVYQSPITDDDIPF
jgi:single-strand DNA-binding protein